MRIEISHEQAKRDHPTEYAILSEHHGYSTSRVARGCSFKQLRIVYDISERVEGCSLGDILSGKREMTRVVTFEDRLGQMRKNMVVLLMAYKGSYHIYEVLKELPSLVIERERQAFECVEKERVRFEGLSEEERDAETLEALKQLAGPGFVGVGLDEKMRGLAKRAGVRVIDGGGSRT